MQLQLDQLKRLDKIEVEMLKQGFIPVEEESESVSICEVDRLFILMPLTRLPDFPTQHCRNSIS